MLTLDTKKKVLTMKLVKHCPSLPGEDGDTQAQTQEVPVGKDLGAADVAGQQGRASAWSMSPTSTPVL